MVNIDKVISLAKAKGVKQNKIAERCGYYRGYLTDAKSGRTSIADEHAETIAEMLGTTAEYLMDETDDPSPRPAPGTVPIGSVEELWELREELRRRPEMRTLFSVTKKATKQDILDAVRIIEALRDRGQYDDE